MDQFHTYLRGRNLAPRTIDVYEQWIRRLERWCWTKRLLADQLTAEQLLEFADTVPETWASRKSLRQALAHWFASHGRTDEPWRQIRMPARPRYTCRALEVDELATLRDTAVLHGGREGLATLCGMYLAARRGEIAALTWDGYAAGRYRWVRSKTGQQADVPVHPVLARALDDAKPRATSMYLFPGDRGRPHVSPTTIWEWVRHVGRLAGIDLATHQLRHSALATANDATGDLRAVQEFAGHLDPATTAIYTRATAQRLRSAIDALDY